MITQTDVVPWQAAPEVSIDSADMMLPTSNTSDPADWFLNSIGGNMTDSGVRVNNWTVLTSGAVYQAVTTKSRDLAAMTIDVIRNNARTNRRTYNRTWDLCNVKSHPEICSFEFRETMQCYVELHGNAVAAIQRDGAGTPSALTPLTPYSVSLWRDPDDGQLWYIHTQPNNGEITPMLPWEVFHISGLGDGLWGYDKLGLMRETVGSSLAAEAYRANQWGNVERPSLVVTKETGKWDQEGQKGFRRQWRERHGGSGNAGRIATLEGTYKLHPVTGITQEQAQLVEQMDKDVAAVARFFNMPHYKMGLLEHSSSRANLEQQQQDYLQSALNGPIVKWQQEIATKLVSIRDQVRRTFSIRFNTKTMLRADTAARYAAYQVAISWGWMSPNEVRELEDMDAIDGGDFYLYPLNMGAFGPDAETVQSTELKPAPPAPPQLPEVPEEAEAKVEAEANAVAKVEPDRLRPLLKQMAIDHMDRLQHGERSRLSRLANDSDPEAVAKFFKTYRNRITDRFAPMASHFQTAIEPAIQKYIQHAIETPINQREFEAEATTFIDRLMKGSSNGKDTISDAE